MKDIEHQESSGGVPSAAEQAAEKGSCVTAEESPGLKPH
jgi:hypothetical protein